MHCLFALVVTSTALLTPSCQIFKNKSGKRSAGTFQTLPGGLQYQIVQHGSGTRHPAPGDHITLNIITTAGDSLLFESRKMYNNLPVPLVMQAPKNRGDLMEGFTVMVAGDSAIFRYPVDSMKKNGTQPPPFAKDGDMMVYKVALVTVRTDEEEKKFQEERAAKQNAIDEKILLAYFEKNKITATKTASGLYYSVANNGEGTQATAGKKVSVNYTGKFLDGKTFDSNTDSAFHHLTPLEFEVGKGKVIKGWDEGLQLLRVGTKATFYIPSSLAYGAMEQRGIPSNSILVFDVELLDVKTPVDQAAADDQLLQDYFKKNNITATKTASGLYYQIKVNGLGNFARPGATVTMNYLGKTLDGKAFDSNTDPQFGHVAPFSFPLGAGRVIKGWEEGVQLLKLGSKATFFIPSGLAYGERGSGGKIPPNAVLIFDVELVGLD